MISLSIALLLNVSIIILEIIIFSKLKEKINILKYYTFLQNFIALIVSIVFSIFAVKQLIGKGQIPELIKGLRYIATCGLSATMFVFAVILAPRFKSGKASHGDIFFGIDTKAGNMILHYICPLISILSFVAFEHQVTLMDSEWTGYAAIPSCTYWAFYIILTFLHLWTEPYGLVAKQGAEKKNHIIGLFFLIAIPAAFILISYLLYWINLL